MAVNHRLTPVVKDRAVQSFQLNASELMIGFIDGSAMKVKIAESNSPPLRLGARIRQVNEDQAKLIIECEDDSTFDVTLAEPGGSGANFKKGRRADPGALGERESLACQIGPKFKLCTRTHFLTDEDAAERLQVEAFSAM